MLGYMSAESLKISIESKEVVFFSRSKNRLWKKGETSGNTLDIISIEKDCDSDSLLIRVNPNGPTCHTGTESCFDSVENLEKVINATNDRNTANAINISNDGNIKTVNNIMTDNSISGERIELETLYGKVIALLEERVVERKENPKEGSYTNYLFDKGIDKILKKVGEESAELIIAAKNKDEVEIKNEAGDLVYHMMVMLVERGVGFKPVIETLLERYTK